MYKEHPAFEPPPPEAILWRYLNFTKFVSLLNTGSLFFARADKLGDPFEGSLSRANFDMRDELYKGKIPQSALEQMTKFHKVLPRFTLINCWHESIHESAAMWKLYAREDDGIAIKTNFAAFAESLVEEEDIFIGRVKYIDYIADFIPENNTFHPYLHKRKSFQHENEVRAMTQTVPSADGKINLSELDSSPDMSDVGRYYKIELSTLVHEVVVAPFAPDWFLELVQSVTNQYNLDVPITKSSLADQPTWG